MARPISPFSEHSLTEWIGLLQQATSPDERYRALLAVKSLGSLDDAVAWSRHSLRDADSAVRALAAKQLGEGKRLPAGEVAPWNEIATELTERLADSDIDVRFETARALGRIRSDDESSKGVLLSLLDDDGIQPLMTASIVTALGERSDVDVALLAPRYGMLLSHEQAEVRESVSAAVAGWDQQASSLVEPLMIALDDEEPLVRENAALALGRAGVASEAILSALRTASTDEDEVVAEAARESLRRLG
ncbi:MAG: HEAT repeat domain-containing protein [Planctomycetota bacterium]